MAHAKSERSVTSTITSSATRGKNVYLTICVLQHGDLGILKMLKVLAAVMVA
jgi:hypothetical protein